MRMKSYFASTVEAAINQARMELGPEAMILSSRKSLPEARHLGEYEVMIAGELAPPALTGGAPATPSKAVDRTPLEPKELLAAEVARMRRELDEMRRTILRSGAAGRQFMLPAPELSEVLARLVAAGIDEDLAQELTERTYARLSAGQGHVRARLDAEAAERALRAEMEERIAVSTDMTAREGGPRITALVGPPGAGKTSALVKLAVKHGLGARRPMQLLTTDTRRIAAADQLRCYATILGVGFQALETVGALAQAIEEHRGKDLILVDTPGFSAAEIDEAAGLASFLATRGDIDCHLVLTASIKSADLVRVVDMFEIFRPSHLLFTRLDETDSFGPLYSEAVRTGKPISFLAAGQQIPEDLEPATTDRILDLVLGRGPARMRSAA